MIWLGVSSVLAWIWFCYWQLVAQLIWLGQLGLSSDAHFYPGLHLIISISEFPEGKPQCIIIYQTLVLSLVCWCLIAWSYLNQGSVWEGAIYKDVDSRKCVSLEALLLYSATPTLWFFCLPWLFFFNLTVYWEHLFFFFSYDNDFVLFYRHCFNYSIRIWECWESFSYFGIFL